MCGTRTSIVCPAGGVALAPSPAASARPFSPRGEGVSISAVGAFDAVPVIGALRGAAAAASSVSTAVPALTLSPGLTSTACTVPAAGDGTSIVALSDSSVTNESSTATVSPGFTSTSITGMSWKSPMSGIVTWIALIFCLSFRCGSARGWRARRVAVACAALHAPRCGLRRIELVLRHRLRDGRRVGDAFIGERLQRRDGHVPAVDLEEMPQLLASVRPAVPVGAEHEVAARHVRTDLVGEGAHVVGGRNDGTGMLAQAIVDVRRSLRCGRIKHVEARRCLTVARKLGERRTAPQV